MTAGSPACTGRDPAVRLCAVEKSYGDTRALRGLDLEIPRGEIRAVLGPNGAGKSTMMSIIAGLLKPDSGRCFVLGGDLAEDASSIRRQIGFAAQEVGTYSWASVGETLYLFARLKGLSGREARRHVAELAERIGLAALMSRRSDQLSGGEQRRLHTAIAMVGAPRLLLLDEPTVGADVESRAALLGLVRSLSAGGTTILYSTHHLVEVEELGSHVTVVANGEVLFTGDPQDMKSRVMKEATVYVRFRDTVPQGIEQGASVLDMGRNWLRLRHDGGSSLLGVLSSFGARASEVTAIESALPTLQGAYLTLTRARCSAAPRREADRGGSPSGPGSARNAASGWRQE